MILIPSDTYSVPVVGILYNATAGKDRCNGSSPAERSLSGLKTPLGYVARSSARMQISSRRSRVTLPAPPAECRYDRAVTTTWPMYDNDSIGDCTIAAAGHLIEVVERQAPAPVVPATTAIVSAYSAI